MAILLINQLTGGNQMSESQRLQIGLLVDFKEHIFKTYDDQRLQNLTDSIKESGVLTPLIVRPIDDGKFEILSGHNRRNAALKAGLTEIPAVVMAELSDEEAKLVVTETNLLQRSFNDMLPSERAKSLIMHYEAAKHQGKRNDLLAELDKRLNARPGRPPKSAATSRQNGEMLENTKDVARVFGVDTRTLQRYFKLKELTDSLFELLDDKRIPFLAAVELAFVSAGSQEKIAKFLNDSERSLTVPQAVELRRVAEANGNKLTVETIKEIVTTAPPASKSVGAIRLGTKTLSAFFSPEQSDKDIEAEIIAALKAYRGIVNDSDEVG
jgi:ParB family chromosome partitioning protein